MTTTMVVRMSVEPGFELHRLGQKVKAHAGRSSSFRLSMHSSAV